MLVDRDKAIEACAKVAESIWDNGREGAHGGEQANRTAAAIRKLTLEDCRVEVGDAQELITRMRERARIRRGIPRAEKDRIAEVLEEASTTIESLSAQVDEEHERAEAYANIASKLQDKLYAAEAQVSELTSENKRICELHKVLMKNADERLEAAEAQVAELREDVEWFNQLRHQT
jgi:chromosome segregation ATPase